MVYLRTLFVREINISSKLHLFGAFYPYPWETNPKWHRVRMTDPAIPPVRDEYKEMVDQVGNTVFRLR